MTHTAELTANGGTGSVDITFDIDADYTGATITNRAEISADNAQDYTVENGYGTVENPIVDIDSMPDADNFNQDGETDDLYDDNILTQDGKNGGDEDDHDPEQIELVNFDLAIEKVLDPATEFPLFPGDDVTFLVEVFNQ